jgi:hypothetical protein
MTTTKTRFPMFALWLLTLLPGNAVVVLDLAHGVVRPAVWAVRFAPALLVLTLVLWAQVRSSPLALRLRHELRLALGPGLLLFVTSGAALCLDAVPDGVVHELLRTMPWVLALVVPSAMVSMPMIAERERGTLHSLLISPLGARAFAEKFAVAAGLVLLSWVQLSAGGQRGTEVWWFALGGHLLALATVPTWFFLTQDDETSLGFVVLAPFVAVAPASLLVEWAMIPVGFLYVAVMLALLPFALRRGLAAGAPAWLRRSAPGLSFLERWASPVLAAELRGQRDAVALSGAAVLAFTVISLMGDAEAATMALFFFCGAATVLSPSLAFTEAQRLGTLEAQLIAQPRRQVFVRRAAASAFTTALAAVLVPLAVLVATRGFSLNGAAAWALSIGVLWTIGLAAAVHFGSVGTALASGIGAAAGLLFAHGGLFVLSFLGTMSALEDRLDRVFPAAGLFLSASLVVLAVAALLVAARRFLRSDRFEPRVLFSAAAVSLTHAAVLGAASVVAAGFIR